MVIGHRRIAVSGVPGTQASGLTLQMAPFSPSSSNAGPYSSGDEGSLSLPQGLYTYDPPRLGSAHVRLLRLGFSLPLPEAVLLTTGFQVAPALIPPTLPRLYCITLVYFLYHSPL